MALVNVKKKIEKKAEALGITEEVHAACTTNPSGTMKRMLARELGGAVAAAASGRTATVTNPDQGMASQFAKGQHFLVLTADRLLLTDVSTWTGSPKKIVTEWARRDVQAIQVDKGRMAAPLMIAFSDGTAVEVEGAKGTNPGALAEAFG